MNLEKFTRNQTIEIHPSILIFAIQVLMFSNFLTYNLTKKKIIYLKYNRKEEHHITAVSRNGEAWDLSEIGKVFN